MESITYSKVKHGKSFKYSLTTTTSNLSSKENRQFFKNVMPRSSNQCCTGRACIPLLTRLQSPEVHNTLLGAKNSSLWNQVQVQAHPASISSPPATHQIPYPSSWWSQFHSFDVLHSSASHFTLAGSQGRPRRCLWQTLQKLFEEPGEKQDSSVPALQGHVAEGCSPSAAPQCLDSQLWLRWVMPEEISFCQPSSQITATRSDQLLRDSTHLMQSFKQAVIVLHWLLFFKLKIAGKFDVSTAQTQGLSGSVVLILVPCWVEIVTQRHPNGSSTSPPSFAFHSTVLVANPSFLELICLKYLPFLSKIFKFMFDI